MNSKKIVTLILSMILILALVGCGKEKSKVTEDESKSVETSNEQSKTDEGKEQENQVKINTKGTETNERTEVQGISVIYPSNWTKNNIKGNDVYLLDSKGTNANLVVESMQGYSEEEYSKASDLDVKNNVGVHNINVQEHNFNNKKARVTYYVQKYQNINMPTYQVTFLNNNLAYIFTLIGVGEVSDENMKVFDNMLSTVEFVN